MTPGLFQLKEKRNSRRLRNGEFELLYTAHNSDDVNYVRAFARQFAPQIYPTPAELLFQLDVEVVPKSRYIMDVRVPYGPSDAQGSNPGTPPRGVVSWGAAGTSGTVHITHAREHIADFAAPDFAAPNYKGAINVEADQVLGMDIAIPVSHRWVEFKHPLGMFNWAMADRLDNLIACVNSKTFMNKPAGEVLLLSYSGQDGTTQEATLRYEFAISKNRDGFQIGDVVNVKKDGHDVVWMEFVRPAGGANPGRIARFVHVERVYERVDFATVLGFG